MKKNNIGMWCQQAKKFLLGNAEAKRERELHKQAYREAQVKEYDGALWLCHRGIPPCSRRKCKRKPAQTGRTGKRMLDKIPKRIREMKVYISQPYRYVSKAEYDYEYKRMSQTIINHGHTPIVPVFDYSPFIGENEENIIRHFDDNASRMLACGAIVRISPSGRGSIASKICDMEIALMSAFGRVIIPNYRVGVELEALK